MPKARVVIGGWYWKGEKRRVGDVLEASAAQIADWEAGGYVASGTRTERAIAPEPERASTDRPAAARDWPHKIKPEQYITRFPDGPDADLARSLLGEITE